MPDFSNVVAIDLALLIKVVFLFLIGLYLIFVLFIVNNIRSLNRIVAIHKTFGSPLIQTIGIFYLVATISLFIAALVIL